MRCDICGRRPSEECCAICHRVHRALWQADSVREGRGGPIRALANHILDNLDQVNSEAVNQ